MAKETNHNEIVVDTFEYLLPARNFKIIAAVTKERLIPLTMEYSLLVLHTLKWATAEDLQSYFGLSKKETGVLLHDLMMAGYVSEEDGGLALTQSGQSLFRESDGDPIITEVAELDKLVTFDLLSVSLPLGNSPGYRQKFAPYMRTIDELAADKEIASNAIDHVRASFQEETFREFNDKFGDGRATTLYSIDYVEPLDVLSLPMSIPIKASINGEVIVEPDFTDLLEAGRVGRSREPIIVAIMQKLRSYRWPRDSQDAFAWLASCDHQLLSQFVTSTSFDLEACISFILSGRKSALAVDGVTEFFIGSSTSDGFMKAYDAVEKSLSLTANDRLIWVAPDYPLWGKGEQFDATARKLREGDGEAAFAIALKGEYPPDHISEGKKLTKRYKDRRDTLLFDEMVLFPLDSIAGSLEIILRPGKFAAVIVYVAHTDPDRLPVPVGFITADASVVHDVHAALSDSLVHRDKWTSVFPNGKGVNILYDKVHSIPKPEKPRAEE
ncbi:hypothetical protein [Thalassospira xiamenensis]|uniref:Uncharacterized protein n=1 Tax=Thalassospira xiamenensis TaxID=220697 RepID=A0A285TYI2_9PROT|nr:hypothetical protein [Thalassospira xiamenensis]SOC27510.1 hypothetical protein SAMN05428964_105444 [Thalassospira xiamenensis]